MALEIDIGIAVSLPPSGIDPVVKPPRNMDFVYTRILRGIWRLLPPPELKLPSAGGNFVSNNWPASGMPKSIRTICHNDNLKMN